MTHRFIFARKNKMNLLQFFEKRGKIKRRRRKGGDV